MQYKIILYNRFSGKIVGFMSIAIRMRDKAAGFQHFQTDFISFVAPSIKVFKVKRFKAIC